MAQDPKHAQDDLNGDFLKNLRTDPESVCKEKSIYMSFAKNVLNNNKVGGKCKIVVGELPGRGKIEHNKIVSCPDNNVLPLTAAKGVGDWFYPYFPGGCGEVTVPLKPAEGTLVVTGGMNGCEIRVYQHGNQLRFFHDANGENFIDKKTKNPKEELHLQGEEVLYIKKNDYIFEDNAILWSESLLTRNNTLEMDEAASSSDVADISPYPQYTFIFVYTKNGWQAYGTGVQFTAYTTPGKKKTFGKNIPATTKTLYNRFKLTGQVLYKRFVPTK